MFAVITGAWRYRGFITSSVINDFKARLSRTRFGAAWIVLQPLAQVLIFASYPVKRACSALARQSEQIWLRCLFDGGHSLLVAFH